MYENIIHDEKIFGSASVVTRKGTCTTGKTTNDDDKRVARRIMSYV